jgi:tetratricopeptide (TPR) repeat protein
MVLAACQVAPPDSEGSSIGEWRVQEPEVAADGPADEAFLRGDFEEAANLYEADLGRPGDAKQGSSPMAWRNYAQSLLATNRYLEALAAFEECLRRSPPTEPPAGDAHLGVARSRLALGDFAGAEAAARDALASTAADEAWASFVLGLALHRQARFAEAESQYLHAMAVGGESEAAWRARERKGIRSFSVQAGSYRNVTSAGATRDHLRDAGFAADIRRFERGPDLYYRVMVGDFPTYDEAQRLLDEVRSKGRVEDAVVFP